MSLENKLDALNENIIGINSNLYQIKEYFNWKKEQEEKQNKNKEDEKNESTKPDPEDQYSIVKWAQENFGSMPVEAICEKLKEELDELLAVSLNREKVGEEIADVFIVLVQLASYHKLDIQLQVDLKMEKNRNRTWKKQENGTFRHLCR